MDVAILQVIVSETTWEIWTISGRRENSYSGVREIYFRSRRKRGLGKPETFDFLGFTFYCGKSYQTGRFKVGLKTSRKKTRKKLKKLGEWVTKRRDWKMSLIIFGINQSLRGYYQYFGISGNSRSLSNLAQKVRRIVVHYMRKRSQAKKLTWDKFAEILRKYLPLEEPRIYVDMRKCATLFAEC